MKYSSGILVTTHIDQQNEEISLSALESMVEQSNSYYIPITVEHDPRKPPLGRTKSTRIKKLEDGEYAIEGIFEMFESGEEIQLDLNDPREIRILEHNYNYLDITYDINYKNPEDQKLIKEMTNILKSEVEPEYFTKKSIEPISVLTIGGAFVLGGIANGFLNKIGADAWDSLKEKLKELFSKKKAEEKEKLLSFEFTIENDGCRINIEVILSNPSDNDIDNFLEKGLKNVDKILPNYFDPNNSLKRIVMEYSDEVVVVKFGVRKDGVPLLLNF